MNSLSWRVVSLPIHTLKRQTKMKVDLFHPLKRRFLSGNPQIFSFNLRFFWVVQCCISSLQFKNPIFWQNEFPAVTQTVPIFGCYGFSMCINLRCCFTQASTWPNSSMMPRWVPWNAPWPGTNGEGPLNGETAGRYPTVTRYKES